MATRGMSLVFLCKLDPKIVGFVVGPSAFVERPSQAGNAPSHSHGTGVRVHRLASSTRVGAHFAPPHVVFAPLVPTTGERDRTETSDQNTGNPKKRETSGREVLLHPLYDPRRAVHPR